MTKYKDIGNAQTCTRCEVEKSIEEFYHAPKRQYPETVCRECRRLKKNAYMRNYISNNWPRVASQRYKTSEEFMKELYESTDVCMICGGPPDRGYGRLCIDHCHETDKVRGLLCNGCNLAISLFKEDVSALARAIEYLNEHQVV